MEKENKKEKFIRLAQGRVNSIITSIYKLGNLSSRINYDYSQEQVEQMFASIQGILDEQKRKFTFQQPQRKLFEFKEE